MADMTLPPLSPGVSPSLLAQPGQMSAAELAKRGEIKDTAKKFEASFLSVMLQQMFEGVQTSTPFGGGVGEDMFKSLMTEAMAKQMTNAGGIGLADSVTRQMLKLQGLN